MNQFGFSAEFQGALLKMLLNEELNPQVIANLRPEYFTSQPLAWAFGRALRYRDDYGKMPGLMALINETSKLDAGIQPLFHHTLQQVEATMVTDAEYVRAETTEWIKRQIFTRSFAEIRDTYNNGDAEAAYRRMMETVESMQATQWVSEDRGWFFEEAPTRQERRLSAGEINVPTGIQQLDHVMNGGLCIGEMGIWIAYPKIGKTTLLVNLGVSASRLNRRRTLHLVFEGSRAETEDRYDSAFSAELYANVRRGQFTANRFQETQAQYEQLRHNLVIRAFTENWDSTVLDIEAEIKELARRYDWKPEVIIIDYGDLLNPRKEAISHFEGQKDVFRDLSTLAKRGHHAVWTASQARRPDRKNYDEDEHILKSRDIADCYEKVRTAHFIGSINQTKLERKGNQMRLYPELYRATQPGYEPIRVTADLSKMAIKTLNEEVATAPTPDGPPPIPGSRPSLGY